MSCTIVPKNPKIQEKYINDTKEINSDSDSNSDVDCKKCDNCEEITKYPNYRLECIRCEKMMCVNSNNYNNCVAVMWCQSNYCICHECVKNSDIECDECNNGCYNDIDSEYIMIGDSGGYLCTKCSL